VLAVDQVADRGAKRSLRRRDRLRRKGAVFRPRSAPALKDWTSQGSPASRWRRARQLRRAQTRTARGKDTDEQSGRARQRTSPIRAISGGHVPPRSFGGV
jgi:hypothetical protein